MLATGVLEGALAATGFSAARGTWAACLVWLPFGAGGEDVMMTSIVGTRSVPMGQTRMIGGVRTAATAPLAAPFNRIAVRGAPFVHTPVGSSGHCVG